MASIIYKYPFPVRDNVTIPIHEGAKILTVQVQHGQPCIWALVDTQRPMVNREFRIYGTGHPFDPGWYGTYVGTFQVYGGDLVFHVFDLERK